MAGFFGAGIEDSVPHLTQLPICIHIVGPIDEFSSIGLAVRTFCITDVKHGACDTRQNVRIATSNALVGQIYADVQQMGGEQ